MIQPATERRIKEVTSLKRKKGRDSTGCYLIEGVRLLESALQSGVVISEVLVTESALNDSRLKNALRKSEVRLKQVSDRAMGKMSDTTTPSGVLAVLPFPEPTTECIACFSKTLVLDGVSDPGNVGTLIRTAAWFGVNAIVAGPGTADFFAPKIVRSTMGGMWSMVLEKVSHLPGFIATNVRAGVDVRVATMNGSPIQDWSPSSLSMIVIGSEAHGVSQEVQNAASGAVSIAGSTTNETVESLNAAIAGGILMSHWGR